LPQTRLALKHKAAPEQGAKPMPVKVFDEEVDFFKILRDFATDSG
jgi:hypothetical protein